MDIIQADQTASDRGDKTPDPPSACKIPNASKGPSGAVWETVKQERNWLVYRLQAKANSDGGKMNKLPVDAKTGRQVGKDEAAKLTFEEADKAREAFNTHHGVKANKPGAFGLGYLPRAGSAMVGGDIDEVHNDQGELCGWARELIADPDTYLEWSPSQNGFRVLMERQPGDEAINGAERNGVGLFANGKKFFTVTGQRIGDTGEITEASGLRERLLERRKPGCGGTSMTHSQRAPSGPSSGAQGATRGKWHGIPPARRAAALTDALRSIPYTDREHWITISAAVHSTIPDLGEDVARAIWDDWCDEIGGPTDENDKTWNSFSSEHVGGASVATVFAKAKEQGWNEAKHVFDILTKADINAQASAEALAYSAKQAKRQQQSKHETNRHDDIDSLVRDSKGRPQFNVSNVIVLMESHDDLQGLFVFDEFQQKIMVMRAVPGQRRKESFPRPLGDSDYTAVQGWFQKNGFPTATKQPVIDAIEAVAQENRVDPLRDHLKALVWDGVSRIHRFADIYLDAGQGHFENEACKRWLISAVARAMEPGCKVDHMLVLEGRQGTGKSSALRILASEPWFGDALPDLGSKDANSYLQGVWLVEVAEMSATKRAEIEQVKAFVTRQEDRFRPAYKRTEVCVSRRCVFAGTTNRDDYLRDETGNRRFWPITVGSIDLTALRRDREQLWAEAVLLYQLGATWQLPSKLYAAAMKAQEARQDEDPWQADVAAYIENNGLSEVSTGAILNELRVDKDKRNNGHAKRVAGILMRLGFEKSGRVTGGNYKGQTRYIKSKFQSCDE
jgi:predicted P-loop ATPase